MKLGRERYAIGRSMIIGERGAVGVDLDDCCEREIGFLSFVMISRVAEQELPEAINPMDISHPLYFAHN